MENSGNSQAPKAADSWSPNVLDAFQYGNNCIGANELGNDPYPQSEDCLYLNVFVPGELTVGLDDPHSPTFVSRLFIFHRSTAASLQPNETVAVMFFIHGGGYMDGSGNDWLYGPEFLVENRVILVTINYRLAVLGFLSLDLPAYSGNMGLKDQQLALKWVHKNIHCFGGDNERITIFGQSAGE